MLRPPPGRFSTTNGWAYLRCSSSASRRAKTSPPPPAASGMTIRTVRVGQLCADDVCADAVAPGASNQAAARIASPRCTMSLLVVLNIADAADARAGPVGMDSVNLPLKLIPLHREALNPRDIGVRHDLGPFGDVLRPPRLESVRCGGHRFAAELPQPLDHGRLGQDRSDLRIDLGDECRRQSRRT